MSQYGGQNFHGYGGANDSSAYPTSATWQQTQNQPAYEQNGYNSQGSWDNPDFWERQNAVMQRPQGFQSQPLPPTNGPGAHSSGTSNAQLSPAFNQVNQVYQDPTSHAGFSPYPGNPTQNPLSPQLNCGTTGSFNSWQSGPQWGYSPNQTFGSGANQPSGEYLEVYQQPNPLYGATSTGGQFSATAGVAQTSGTVHPDQPPGTTVYSNNWEKLHTLLRNGDPARPVEYRHTQGQNATDRFIARCEKTAYMHGGQKEHTTVSVYQEAEGSYYGVSSDAKKPHTTGFFKAVVADTLGAQAASYVPNELGSSFIDNLNKGSNPLSNVFR